MKRVLLFLFLIVAAGLACERYEPPPRAMIQGLAAGVLTDSRAPLFVDFGVPIDPDTLSLKIAVAETDVEGNLFDEDADPETNLKVLVAHDPLEGDFAGRTELEEGGTRVRIVPEAALPVGPQLMLIVEPGVRATSGAEARTRQRVLFAFTVACTSGRPTRLASGVYFALLDVEEPIGTQIQLFAVLEVDPSSGALVAQFTNADRNPNARCPSPCGSADVCRLLPAPACVAPSTRAGTVDEHPDFVPNVAPPTGYSFFVRGCAADDEAGATGVSTAPATLVVQSPPVTIEALTMTGSFTEDPGGTVRATGSLAADTVRLGTNPLGGGKGTLTAVRLPDEAAPPGIPRPPPITPASSDGGSGGAP